MKTVSIIISYQKGIIIVDRKEPPFGFAFPGGYIDEGELPKQAIIREIIEEVGIGLRNIKRFCSYNNHLVFTGDGYGLSRPGDDVKEIVVINPEKYKGKLCFHDSTILKLYNQYKNKKLNKYLKK